VGICPAASQIRFGYASNGWHQVATAAMTFKTNTFYHLKIEAAGSRIRVFVKDTNSPALDVTNSTFGSGMVGVRIYSIDGNQCLSGYSNLVVQEFR
jgi:hypothetical protein